MRKLLSFFFLFFTLLGFSQNPVTTSLLTTPDIRMKEIDTTRPERIRYWNGHLYWGHVRIDTLSPSYWNAMGDGIYNNNPGGVAIGTYTATTQLTIAGNINLIPIFMDSTDVDGGIPIDSASAVIIYKDTNSAWYDWTYGSGAVFEAGYEGQLIILISSSSGKLYLRNNVPDNGVAFEMFGGDNITIQYQDGVWREIARTDFAPYYSIVIPPGGPSVTYVGAEGLNGIRVTGSPITGIGTFYIENIAIDSTVIRGGLNVTVDSIGRNIYIINSKGADSLLPQGLNSVMAIDSNTYHQYSGFTWGLRASIHIANNTNTPAISINRATEGAVPADSVIGAIWGGGSTGYWNGWWVWNKYLGDSSKVIQFNYKKIRLEMRASQTWTQANNGTYFAFLTTSNNASIPEVAMTINQDKTVDITNIPTVGTASYTLTENAGVVSKYVTPTNYEKEVVNDSENNWTIPFTLRPSSVIIYNGMPLRSGQWSGANSTILAVNINVRKYDHLVIIP